MEPTSRTYWDSSGMPGTFTQRFRNRPFKGLRNRDRFEIKPTIVNLQSGLDSELSQAGRNAVKIFLREDALRLHETAVESNDIADKFLANKRRRVEASRYRSTLHVSATSNIC
jgi:hypothetical protein